MSRKRQEITLQQCFPKKIDILRLRQLEVFKVGFKNIEPKTYSSTPYCWNIAYRSISQIKCTLL